MKIFAASEGPRQAGRTEVKVGCVPKNARTQCSCSGIARVLPDDGPKEDAMGIIIINRVI